MKNKISVLILVCLLSGCASGGKLTARGEYTETVCRKEKVEGKKKFYIFPVYKEGCKDVKKEGLHVTKRIDIWGVGVKVDFKNETGEGGSFIPPLPPLKLEN